MNKSTGAQPLGTCQRNSKIQLPLFLPLYLLCCQKFIILIIIYLVNSQTSLTGSARYMGMGGAFGALGADATAIKDNPAGLGVFRSSEIAFTINGAFQSNNADWKGKHTKESGNNLRFDALSYVMAMPIYNEGSGGLVGSNFSFTYNE